MSRLRNFLLAFVSLFVCACEKAPLSNGDVKKESRTVEGSFIVLEMADNVDVRLVKDTHLEANQTKIEIKANENLLNNIVTEIHGDTLTIQNTSIAQWMRPYNCTVEATVHYDSLYQIIFNSNGTLFTDTIHGYPIPDSVHDKTNNHFYLDILGGSGDINIIVDCDHLHTYYDWGTSSVFLKGNSGIASTTTSYNSHGPINAQDLETTYHFIYSYGTNKVIAKAFNEIHADNNNNGIICFVRYYVTKPQTIWGHYEPDGEWVPTHVVNTTHRCPKNLIYKGDPRRLDSIVMD